MSEPPEEGIVSSRGELLLYATEDGHSRVECRFAEDTLWLSQTAMMELYQTTRPNVSLHLKNIFEESELDEEAVVKSYLTTAADGKSYQVKHYSLEAVLAVGYRVRSERGTQFRQWATARLSEYLVKGFTLDDERLKNPAGPDRPDYFDELLQRIRDIRASERQSRHSDLAGSAGLSHSEILLRLAGVRSTPGHLPGNAAPSGSRQAPGYLQEARRL